MEKVKTNKNNKKGLFGFFAAFALAIGVGVSLAPRSVLSVSAATMPATMTAGENGSAYKVNDKDAIKVGTSSKGGDMTVTVGSGAVKLSFYAAAWNGVTGLSLKLTGAIAGTTTFSLTADSNIAGTPTSITLNGDESDYYFETTLSGITSETNIKLETSIAKRFVIWSATYETPGGVQPESMELDTDTLNLDILGTHQLVPRFEPEGATAGVSYDIIASNPAGVVSVNAFGLVTALKTGTATIVAETTDGSGLDAAVNITVTANYSSSVLTPAEAQELATGANVLVRGKVVADIKNAGSYAIQVGDRGIMTYGINDLTVGNDYIIAGKMAAYQGMPQISNATSIIDMGPSTTTVTPKVVSSVSELTAKLSGTLVKINGLKYKSGSFSTSAASNVTFTLGSTDLVIRATKDVPNSAINAANTIFSSTGPDDDLNVTTISGWYNGAQLLFSEETIIQKVVPMFGDLDRIELNTANVVTSYYVGETFSLSGLVVTAYDETDLAKIVTAEATSSLASGYTFVASDIGSKTITISYEEGVVKEETFNITVAVAPVWTKATMVYTGSSTTNMGTSNNATTVGLNSTLFNVQANKGAEAQQNNVGLNKDGTIRLYWHANGGNILTVSIASGKEISKLVFNFGGTVAKAKISVDSEEKYNAEPSSSGVVTLEHLKGSSFSIENVNDSSKQIWISSVEIYYENASDPVYEEAKAFADFIMAFDGGDAQGMSDSFATCEDNLLDAMIEWEGLSADAKDLFKTHADFTDARQRLMNWLLANGFDSFDDLDVSGPELISKNKDSNAITATIIIGVIGFTTLAGYYFLKKKKTERI